MSTPLMIDWVPKWWRMPYSFTSSGNLARSRSRRIRKPRFDRFHTVSMCRQEHMRGAGRWCFRISLSSFTMLGTNWITRGRGSRCVRLVLCWRSTITPWSRSTLIPSQIGHFARSSPGVSQEHQDLAGPGSRRLDACEDEKDLIVLGVA